MNPLTNVKNVQKLSERELKGKNKTSWHDQYRGSAWLFIGGFPYDLSEGDLVCVFSQYGEPVNVNLVRDKDTGKSKGFCFLCYEDQRSTDLAVDNLNGIKLLGRTLRVDHVENYKAPKERKDDDEDTKLLKREGLAAVSIKKEVSTTLKYKEVIERKVKIEKKTKTQNQSFVDRDEARRKRSSKEAKLEKRRKKKRDSSSSSSDSSSGSSDSDSDGSTASSSTSSEEVKRSKKDDSKSRLEQFKGKSIKELKLEEKRIEEELNRRRKCDSSKEKFDADRGKDGSANKCSEGRRHRERSPIHRSRKDENFKSRNEARDRREGNRHDYDVYQSRNDRKSRSDDHNISRPRNDDRYHAEEKYSREHRRRSPVFAPNERRRDRYSRSSSGERDRRHNKHGESRR